MIVGIGVDVVLVEPGLIRTGFGDTAAHSVSDATPGAGPYAAFNANVAATTLGAYEGRLASGPMAVAKTIERAISKRRPRTRYPVTLGARILLMQRRLMTDRMWDAAMRTQFKPPRAE